MEKSANLNENTVIDEMVSAQIDVIGYRDSSNLLQVPRTTFRAGADVCRASGKLVQSVLGLRNNTKVGGYIGLLHGHDLPVTLDINELLQKHVCILAKTGAARAMSGDIIEEMMKRDVTTMIIDPHGEYGAMRDMGKVGEPRFGVVPRGYADRIREFSVLKSEDPNIRPLRFTLKALEARELLELTRTNDVRSYLTTLKKAIDALREHQEIYSLRDLIDVLLSLETDNKSAVLINELEYLDEIGIFATLGNKVSELVEEGKTTIIT